MEDEIDDCNVDVPIKYLHQLQNLSLIHISALFSGLVNGVIGTSYTSEDSDLVAVENNYAAKENDLDVYKRQSTGSPLKR